MFDIAEAVGELIDNSCNSIISSVDSDGFPSSRAMLSPRKRDGIHTLYIPAKATSMRLRNLIDNPKSSLYFYDKKTMKSVMLKGTAELIQDPALKAELWREGDQEVFPNGADAPEYCIIRFSAKSGRYYHNHKYDDFQIS